MQGNLKFLFQVKCEKCEKKFEKFKGITNNNINLYCSKICANELTIYNDEVKNEVISNKIYEKLASHYDPMIDF